jgi:hypothetical protein
MKNNIIGVTGFARSGKDTFYKYSSEALNRGKCYRYAFADALKEECDSFLQSNLGISAFTEKADEKELIRPFLVTYGTEIRRKLDPFCWIKKIEASIEKNHPPSDKNFIFITDVRFKNEAEWVRSLGGLIVQITREGFGPANQDEHVQSSLIKPLTNLHVMWPSFGAENLDDCKTYLDPIIKKNFRKHTDL